MNEVHCLVTGCVYHACMSNHCQKAIVLEQGYDWGPGDCGDPIPNVCPSCGGTGKVMSTTVLDIWVEIDCPKCKSRSRKSPLH